MTDTATQQPSPTKRGRGRGRGGAGRGAASARARGKPTTGRRGRAKVYETSRAQAAHERQRDLKNSYAALSAAMKPALEELADRNLDLLKSNFDAHKEVDQYKEITNFLDQRLDDTLTVLEEMNKMSEAFIRHELNAKHEYTHNALQVCTLFALNNSHLAAFDWPVHRAPANRLSARIKSAIRLRNTTTSCSDVSTSSSSCTAKDCLWM